MKNKSDSLYLIIPTYNEEETISKILTQWYGVIDTIDNSQLILIDDGSTDRTYEIVRNFQQTHPKLKIIHTKNQGHGNTISTGYRYAIQQNAAYIFQTDSDGQTSPDMFPVMWEQRHQYALSIGYRKHRKDGLSRICVTKLLRILLFLMFGYWILDANCPYRLMEGTSLKKIMHQLPTNCELTNIYITIAYMQAPKAVCSYEIPFDKRQGGRNSIHIPQILQIGIRNLHTFWQFRKRLKQESELTNETL